MDKESIGYVSIMIVTMIMMGMSLIGALVFGKGSFYLGVVFFGLMFAGAGYATYLKVFKNISIMQKFGPGQAGTEARKEEDEPKKPSVSDDFH